jgi:hypothetical protein
MQNSNTDLILNIYAFTISSSNDGAIFSAKTFLMSRKIGSDSGIYNTAPYTNCPLIATSVNICYVCDIPFQERNRIATIVHSSI